MPASSVSRLSSRGSVTKPKHPTSKSRLQTLNEDQSEEFMEILRNLQDDQKSIKDVIAEQERLLANARSSISTNPRKIPQKTHPNSVSMSAKPSKKLPSPKSKSKEQETEKRQRRFRSRPPASFEVKLHRARTQRMVVLGRRRLRTEDDAPIEEIDIVGSTGNVYTVTIGHVASCTCPDSTKGNECKHKVYALQNVLKAPEDLVYQLAFLTSELEQMFENAPSIPTDVPEYDNEDSKGNRKSTDGECPICYMDLDPSENILVWCKAECGHNLHKLCFEQWAASQRGQEVRCVYCRTPWPVDSGDFEAIKKAGEVGEDGYLNVAEHFGLSRARDYTGYHQPWVRRTFGVGG